MRTRIVFPWNGPAKSRCSFAQGLDGHFQGLSGAGGGEDCTCWHSPHLLTNFSMLESIPGHQTYILARLFIFEIPRWPSCNSCSTATHPSGGITTLIPPIRHPSYDDSSRRCEEYGSSSESPLCGHPHLTYCRTQGNLGSRLVQVWMSTAGTGDSSRCSTRSTSSGLIVVLAGSSGSDRRLSASMLA